MVHCSWRKWLFCSCGILDGSANFICCLACRSLYRQLRCSRANFDVSWLNSAGT
jgi:hypothetical protein